MRVLALTKYGPLGASSRVRTYQYTPTLLDSGIEFTALPLLADAYLRQRYTGRSTGLRFLLASYARRVWAAMSARRYDLVWIEKELMPWAPGLLERALLARTPYALDYDDAIFHSYDRHPNPLLRKLYGRKIDALMRGSSLVVAGNGYLADRARRAGARRVEVIPSVIDLRRYGPVTPEPEGPFTIGWIGSPGSERLLESIRDVLGEAARSLGVRILLVGASGAALPGVPHETLAWSEATEVDHMRRFHVGIMPLTDTPWERGKCGYKLIQCMAVGRPVVASPVGVNAEVVSGSGLLASTQGEWTQAFRQLRDDGPLRVRLGLAGRRAVESRYDLSVTAPLLARALRVAAGARGGTSP